MSLLYYFDVVGIEPMMVGLFSLPILSVFAYMIGCCSKSKSKISPRKKCEERVTILEKSVRTLCEHFLKHNARVEGLELNMGKMIPLLREIDNLKQDLSDMDDKNEEFNQNYKEFYNHVMRELRILRDATFVPDEPGQNDEDSDFEP